MKAGAVNIDGLDDPDVLRYKAMTYDEFLTTLGHELEHLSLAELKEVEELLEGFNPGMAIEGLGGVKFPEEMLDNLRPGMVFRVEGSGTISVVEPGWRPSQPLPSSQDAVAAYLTRMEDGGAAEGYVKVRARKLRFFARQHPHLPTDAETIRIYLRQFRTDNVPTRLDQWKALSALYKFASDTYDLLTPMLKVDKPRFKTKPGQRLSRDQAKRFLSVVETDLEWAAVTCYFGLRFRRIEAERLLFGDIKEDYLIVRGKERTEELPLLPVFRDKLLRLANNPKPNDRLFPVKGDDLAYHIARLFKRAGIEGVRGSPHTLRNTAGRLWLTYGGDDRANRQLLRHSNRTMTDHYSELNIDELYALEERHNPMLNLLRELGSETLTNTTGVRETEAANQIETAISTYQANTSPAQLPELLDQMIALGQRAQELRHSLGGNGHWPQELKEVMQYLEHRAK